MPSRTPTVETGFGLGMPGPTGNVMRLSQLSLHSSQKPHVAATTSTSFLSGGIDLSSSTGKLPVGTMAANTITASAGQLPAPINTSTPVLQGYPVHGSALTSSSSLMSHLSFTYQPVAVEQVATALMDSCMNLSLLYTAHNFAAKDSQVLVLLQDIRDQFAVRQSDVATRLSSAFIGRWLWAFHTAINRLNECVYKMRDAKLSAMFTTNSSRRAKIEKYFNDVLVSWQELVLNLGLAMMNSLSPTSAGSTENLQIAQTVCAVDPFQMCLLGDKHLFGYGVPKSYDLAFKYYTAAAKRGSAEAMNMLGCMYEQGLGQTANQSEAMAYYQKGADLNLADAINNVGRMYEKQQNYQFASDYYLRAARIGHVDSMVSLGFMLENGLGSSRDLDKAEEWYALASTKQYSRAQNCLGSLFYRKNNAQDDADAVRYFKLSAKQGNAHALNNLGICYEEGRGVEKNLMLAKEHYLKSAELNHSSGANNLGFVLLTEKNYREAFKWFNIASALGSVDALYNLGTLWESGVLHPNKNRDYAMARYYYEEACRRGCDKARIRLVELNSTSTK